MPKRRGRSSGSAMAGGNPPCLTSLLQVRRYLPEVLGSGAFVCFEDVDIHQVRGTLRVPERQPLGKCSEGRAPSQKTIHFGGESFQDRHLAPLDPQSIFMHTRRAILAPCRAKHRVIFAHLDKQVRQLFIWNK